MLLLLFFIDSVSVSPFNVSPTRNLIAFTWYVIGVIARLYRSWKAVQDLRNYHATLDIWIFHWFAGRVAHRRRITTIGIHRNVVDIVDLVAIKFDWFGRTLIIIIIILLCYCAGLNRIHIRLEGGRQAGRKGATSTKAGRILHPAESIRAHFWSINNGSERKRNPAPPEHEEKE